MYLNSLRNMFFCLPMLEHFKKTEAGFGIDATQVTQLPDYSSPWMGLGESFVTTLITDSLLQHTRHFPALIFSCPIPSIFHIFQI